MPGMDAETNCRQVEGGIQGARHQGVSLGQQSPGEDLEDIPQDPM